MPRKVLIDLYMLKYPHCGFGQIAWNQARYFRDEYTPDGEVEYTLLVPSKWVGAFGDKVKYERAAWYKKFFPRLAGSYDLWHSTDQLPRFRPAKGGALRVVTVHDFNHEYEKRGTALLHARKRMRRLLEQADQVVCISRFAEADLHRFAPWYRGPVEVIYNGVESLAGKEERRPGFVEDGKPFFFTIGEVREKKNFHVLLDLMKRMPEYNLYIAGSDTFDYAALIRRRVEDENIGNVRLVGRVDDPWRVWLYRHCAAFLFPSLFEGFGLPVIEAMQFGRPVFCSDKTSLKEIGADCAWFWNRFDPDYMERVIRDGLAAYDGCPEYYAGRAVRYAATYSYARNRERLRALYLRLLSGVR